MNTAHRLALVMLTFTLMGAASAIPPPLRYCPEEEGDAKAISEAPDRIAVLTAILSSQSSDARRAKCLGEFSARSPGDDGMTALLLDVIASGPPPLVRWQAAVMLEKMERVKPGQVRTLMTLIEREKDDSVAVTLMSNMGLWLSRTAHQAWPGDYPLAAAVRVVAAWQRPGVTPERIEDARAAALHNLIYTLVNRDGSKDAGLWAAIADGLADSPRSRIALDAFAMAVRHGRIAADSSAVMRIVATATARIADPVPAWRSSAIGGISAALAASRAEAIPGWFDQNALDRVVAALVDDKAPVRMHAAELMSHLPALPASARPALERVLAEGGAGAIPAMSALATLRTPEVAELLVARLRQPNMRAVAEHPEGWRKEFEFDASDRIHLALRKVGRPAVLPLLRHLASTRSAASRKALYDTLVAIHWTAGLDQGALLAAIGPALDSSDADIRMSALSLLATWRPLAVKPFPSALVDKVLKQHLPIPADAPRVTPAASHVMFLVADDLEWRLDPQVAAVIVAGNSRSAFAARHMIRWMCSGRRLEVGKVVNASTDGAEIPDGQLDTIRDSLVQMGRVARRPVREALAARPDRNCRETLAATAKQLRSAPI